VQQLPHLFLLCMIAVGVRHRPFLCHFQVNELFLYPFKVLLPSLFGVHVFVMVGVMCCLVPFYHFYVEKVGVVKSDIGCCDHHRKRPASFCCHHFV